MTAEPKDNPLRGLTLGDLRRKPSITASREYVAEVAAVLDLDHDTAERVADYVLAEIEREGTFRATLTFDDEGNGPFCSWCRAIGGLCYHLAGGGTIAEQARVAAMDLPPTVSGVSS
jgi:hypothetical protein